MSELSRKAREADHGISDSTLGQMAKGEYSGRPSRRTLSALAFLAGVSYETAEAAAGVVTDPARPFSAQMPAEVNTLNPRRRRLANEVLRELISAQRLEDQVVSDVSFLTDEDLDGGPGPFEDSDQTGESPIG